MSNLEKEILEQELVIKKAKYRVKNAEGKYEVVYLETSADQVEETADRVFVTPDEKSQITTNKNAIAAETEARTEAVSAINGKIDVINGNESTPGSINKALKDAKDYTDAKVQEVNNANASLAGRVTANETAISDLRDAISNKNSNTIVVDTEAEIATANAAPKVGDLAYVITSKRAYIYKGVEALTAKNAPAGWVVFDEITNELDLVDYLKKTDAEATYRKIADKIAEADLAVELSTKINNKADASYVNTELAKKATPDQITSAVSPVSEKANANKSAIAQEVTDRKGEITRVEGVIDTKVGAVNTAFKAEDAKLNNRISKFAPVISSVEPVDTEAGHVWLELI